MKHLSASLLNRYLDQDLSTDELHRVEIHLDECPACSARLEQLLTLASSLKTYREEALSRDLAPLILRRLPERRSRWGFRLLLAAQAGISVGLVVLLAAAIDRSYGFQGLTDRFIPRWPVLLLPANPLSWLTGSEAIQGLTWLMDRFLSMTTGLDRADQFLNGGILLPIRGPNLLLIGAAVCVLGILGNTALLAHRREA